MNTKNLFIVSHDVERLAEERWSDSSIVFTDLRSAEIEAEQFTNDEDETYTVYKIVPVTRFVIGKAIKEVISSVE